MGRCGALFALLVIGLSLFATTAFSLGIGTMPLDNRTLPLQAGQDFNFTLTLQNEDETPLNVSVTINSPIATLIGPAEYELPAKTFGTQALIAIHAPEDAAPGTRYSVDYVIKPLAKGEGQVPLTVEYQRGFFVIVGEAPPPIITEAPQSLWTSWRVTLALVVAIIVLTLLLRTSNRIAKRVTNSSDEPASTVPAATEPASTIPAEQPLASADASANPAPAEPSISAAQAASTSISWHTHAQSAPATPVVPATMPAATPIPASKPLPAPHATHHPPHHVPPHHASPPTQHHTHATPAHPHAALLAASVHAPSSAPPSLPATSILDRDAGDKAFHLNDGSSVQSLRELRARIPFMDEATFHHHVTEHRNDFALWTRHALAAPALADTLSSIASKEDLARVLDEVK